MNSARAFGQVPSRRGHSAEPLEEIHGCRQCIKIVPAGGKDWTGEAPDEGAAVTLEFDPKEVRDLKDLGSSPLMPEQELKEVYDRVIRRAAASLEKPDSLFMLRFIRRPSFMRKSSHREKLLTLLGALQSSVPWSGTPFRATGSNRLPVSRFDHRGRPV